MVKECPETDSSAIHSLHSEEDYPEIDSSVPQPAVSTMPYVQEECPETDSSVP